ncbi:DUF6192 family protein [Actinoplanes sp. NEAU-A12]|uniref:DUF6192 family protein n=1 Tax=Actinoplanes sandaracinus TaxID=3045177 RepID=A0ABT6X0N1_9ACTN|nr:DUF6192 family protein [Actinoplanes sandaracinus]MDI6105572.1 DUF6192 family protein [Actinoplanes sandaracinus]
MAETRELITQRTRIQFRIGDLALEIEPMRRQGGASSSDAIFGTLVSQVLARFAEDVGMSLSSVNKWRWVASRWPTAHRRDEVPHYIHEILAPLQDERQRFATLADPPVDQRTGARRWTPDAAKRLMGRQVERPETVQEKVVAVHALVNDEEVASRVAQDLLRRPEVASKAMTAC